MSETANISAMAQKVSKEIFSLFGWRLDPPHDQNWNCVNEAHEKKTHPSDAIFSYEDPYANRRIYLNTDLKSYAKQTITKVNIAVALRDLAKSVECSNKSDGWAALYADKSYPYVVDGLLFVFNHDGDYDKDFDALRESIDEDTIPVARGNKVTVLGPKQIAYLATVANDIERLVGRGTLPAGGFRYYYPDLISRRPKLNRHPSASIEMLTGPWQVIHFTSVANKTTSDGYVIYYAGAGDTPEEFKYLFDFFFRYQLLQEDTKILLRLPFAHADANVFFARAVDQFSQAFYDLPDMKSRLAQIEFESITNVVRTFSQSTLGMSRG